jgi:hypothetical protein
MYYTPNNIYEGYPVARRDNCCCNFSTLVILILVLLQFGKGRGRCECKKSGFVDNGILFIIALYFLACCNPCKTF